MAHAPSPARPVQLHVIHDLGGGAAKWLADYSQADTARTNLVLRPFAHDNAMASGVALFMSATDAEPVKSWRFSEKIPAAAVAHPEYRAALDEIVARYGVVAILVSSLIGHSLDALDTGLPTIVVCHDYFPYCPAINLYFDGVCQECDGERVAACGRENGKYNPFDGFGPEDRVRVRECFVEFALRPNVVLATPSASVQKNLKRLDARFERAHFATIPHGYANPLPHVELGDLPPHERLRILVMGQVSVAKGLELLREAIPRLEPFADVFFLGSREAGELFRFTRHVHVVTDYDMAALPGHMRSIRPHVGLLASVVSETFGYALSELWMMGIPVAATRVGSFGERIEHGVTGYLYDPDPPSLVSALRSIDRDRATLARIRATLRTYAHRTPEEMVADYHRLARIEPPEGAASPAPHGESEKAEAVEAVTIASMWKEVRRLHVHAAMLMDARQEAEAGKVAEAEKARRLAERLQAFGKEIADREALLLQKDIQLEQAAARNQAQEAKVAEILGSTSWRITAPMRSVARSLPGLRRFARFSARLVLHPVDTARRVPGFLSRWRSGGWEAARGSFAAAARNDTAWIEYRRAFEGGARQALAERAAALDRKPLISIVVPVFDTDESMLERMLDSVRAQVYPQWELCVADDGSAAPHVRRVLERHAARDPRVKVSFSAENRGVSHASNRALAMATGEYVALLDHDDILEEHALLRVAESIVRDHPDLVYSDEVLTTTDGETVTRYTFRPAYSPEYLLSHPYIVHLTCYRAALLREIGGWDESLRISQDYDLLLRASEKLERVVHIPEILYRWRIHGTSSGIAQQGQVMEVSKGALRRHLQRTGEKGTVEDGESFNFFSVRHPVGERARVAIVIPTRNHGTILAQCIDSIRRTVSGIDYDIVVVDHESDDPATLDYLASIAREVEVIRYKGPFNFGAINNHAIGRLDPAYSHYLLCNNDVEALEPGWLQRLLELGQQRDVGIVGPMLLYPDRKTVQHAGVGVGLYRGAEHYGKFLRYPEDSRRTGGELLSMNREVAAVTAACMLVRADAWHEAGGFDESIAVGFGDVDLCLKIGQLGFRVVYCGRARLVHHESLTRGVSETDPHPVDTSVFRQKWKELLAQGDPYYSPNLSPNSTRWETRASLPLEIDFRRRLSIVDRESGRLRVLAGMTDR